MMPDDPESDFLATAFRQSRSAIDDAGFSLEFERRVLAWRRRRRLLRWLPLVMAIIGLCVAAVFHGFAIPTLSFTRPTLPSLAALAQAFAPVSAVLSKFGIQPWMVCAGLLVVILAIVENRRDQRLAFRL
jgi:hypothetical protein